MLDPVLAARLLVGDDREPGEEVEVLEEGRPQAIAGFRFVERGTPPPLAGAGGAAPAAAATTPRHPTLVTLVFDSLGQEGRAFARSAALGLVRGDERPELLFSVFVVGNRLLTLAALIGAVAMSIVLSLMDRSADAIAVGGVLGAPLGAIVGTIVAAIYATLRKPG